MAGAATSRPRVGGRVCSAACGVTPGDLVVGDDDGIVIAPRPQLEACWSGRARSSASRPPCSRGIQGGASTDRHDEPGRARGALRAARARRWRSRRRAELELDVAELRQRAMRSACEDQMVEREEHGAERTGAVLSPDFRPGAGDQAVGGGHRERERDDGLTADLVLGLAVLVQVVAGGATSVASSPNTPPMRPPDATSQTDTPPQWSTVWTPPGGAARGRLTQPWRTRVATCGLSRPTKLRARGRSRC
jgi:hypothetical protein